jgi:hypothetical protein
VVSKSYRKVNPPADLFLTFNLGELKMETCTNNLMVWQQGVGESSISTWNGCRASVVDYRSGVHWVVYDLQVANLENRSGRAPSMVLGRIAAENAMRELVRNRLTNRPVTV